MDIMIAVFDVTPATPADRREQVHRLAYYAAVRNTVDDDYVLFCG